MRTLLTKGRGYIMPLVLLLLLFSGNRLLASPDCPIISARFPFADGTTVDNSATGWYLDASRVASTGYFAVKSNRFHAQELGGEGIWYSKVFSTAGYTDWQVAVKITSEGDMNSTEYVKIYYKINGGSEILLSEGTGNFGTLDFTSPLLNGNNVQLVVKIYNYNNGGSQTSKYYIEEYRLFKEEGPCAGTIPVTATAANGGLLTCTNPSLTLSASSSASGVTYSWTGPNNFTSTAQNPVISTAGTYTVVGTSSSGSGSATVTVTENKVIPDLSATGGNLACGTSVTLNASSSVANVTYSWTGPNSFTSTAKSPVVSTAGTYTVTIRNPVNGCTNSQSVTVTSGSAAATTTWEENFTLSNGTTSRSGTINWTTTRPSGSTFAVNNNEFRATAIGTTGDGVWTSGSISIAGKTNVSISVNTRSSGVAMNTSGTYADYIRFYYKLNGGSEVLFADKNGNINSHSTTNSTVSVSGLSGTSLQIIIKARATGSDEFYYFDNVKVTAVDPAVTLTTSVSGPVTCTSNATITVTPRGTVSSYAWTGPNGFTSTAQNPTVTAGGQYIVTATLPGGCTVSTPVTVTENKAQPDLTATGGALGCLSSVTINASSSVANATYSWTGPNSFTSTAKSPVVSATGTYTVTVKNPANGCTNTQSVQVTAGTATPTAFWWEDFTLANGTAVDNGSTSWTLSSSGTGTASVQNNEFKVSYEAGSEAVWTSGVVDISGKSNVVITADLRSETASASDPFESDDYMRVYYKLNGGAEVLVFEDVAGLGTTTTGTATASVTSAALSGSTLQVIIKARNSHSTERYFFDNVKLTGTAQSSSVTATASVTDSLTCARTSITLSGSSNVTGATYSWTGPGSFTSTAQNPAVSAAGNYILTATDPGTGCAAKDTVTVTQHITAPGASAGVSGSLTCATATVTLLGGSGTAGAVVNYSWTGPGGFTSTAQNPVVSVAGNYILTVTNPANGCTAKDTVTVTSSAATTSNFWVEDFTLSNGTTVDNGTSAWSIPSSASGSTFSVNNNEFRISGQTTTGESVWNSAVINITGKTGVGIAADTRSSVTGGAVMNESGTYADYLRFYYKLNGGSEVLFAQKKSDINGHSTTWSNVSVSGLSGTSLQIVIRARATGTDEFYYVDNVKVTGTAAGDLTAIAAVNGQLTCDTTAVTLSGSSNIAGVTYSWTGPDNFTSTSQTPATGTAGDYILTVTNPATGCTAKDTVTVIQFITPPGATAGVSGPLSCATTAVTLTGSATTAGVTYSWTGPNFTSSLQNPSVGTAGLYTLTVKNPANGCTSTATVEVTFSATASGNLWVEDFTLSNGTTVDNGTTAWSIPSSASGSTFAVNNNEFRISGQNTTGESVWASGVINITGKTGVGISADARSSVTGSAVMNETGTYADYIRFYYKLNGGAEVLFAEKKSDINGHSAAWSNVSVSGLSTGTSLQLVIRARATGTDEFYYVDNVKVTGAGGNIDATAGVSGPLSCKTTSVTLSGSSTTAGVTYSWAGPNNYAATQQNPVVTVAGPYTLTVAAPGGGCSANATVTVLQNVTKPNLTVTQPAVLNCTTTTANLTAATTTTGTTITWTGFAAGQNPVSVSAAGKYYVTAKDTVNGCTSIDSVTVTQDLTKPNLTVTQPGVLSCNTTSVNLTAATTTIGATITWTGFTAGQNPVSVSAAGKYYVTAKATNGCTKLDSVTVIQDNAKPNVTITQPSVLTCSNISVNLTAGSTTSGVTFTWTGYAEGLNPIAVSAPGTYTVTAKTANGCTNTTSVTVLQDVTKPNLTVTQPAVLSCTVTSVNLSATSAGSTITWTGFASGQNPVSVTTPGKYYVTATSTNGCTKLDSVTVTQNITKPTLTVTQPAVLNCTVTSVNLTATSAGSTITWTGFASGQNPVSVTTPGKYYVTATSTNGCTKLDSVTVTQNITKPNLSVTQPAVLTCTNTSVNLTATSAGSTITWTGFASGQNPVSVTTPGKYYVTATSTNGCTKLDSVTVTQDNTKPTLTITQPAVLNCTVTSVNLTATSAGSTITWTGFATGQNPVSVTAPGTYTVTATTANGCTTTENVTVDQDIAKPNLTVTQPAVLTCTTTSVNLTATSAGSTITWIGFASGQNPVSVTTPGKYYVTATSTNGCTKLDSVTVTQNITKPTVTVTQPAVLTCTATSVNLNATSAGSTITWTGFATGQNPVSVTTPGKYYVTATASNGCTKLDSVTVTQDITKPNLSVTPPAVLTCTATSVNLTATSAGSTITWTGFASGQNPVSVTTPGKYYVTATASNGCTKLDSITVTQNITKPTVTVTQPAVLTCTITAVNLTATSAGSTITWTGFATGQNPVSVTTPGKYYVTATASNGCTKLDSVTVTQDITKPNLSVTPPAVLTCTATSVNLTATSAGSTITWTGFASGQNPVSVTAPGKYYVTATATNGCTKLDSVTVTQDNTKPTLTITQPAVLNCTVTSVNLTATSAGSTITWTGFASGQNPVSVTTPGKYYVTATATNGCTKLDSVTVTQDITKPTITVTQPPVLTCTITAVNLTATSAGSTITWTGFASGQNPVSVTTPGKYYVTATASNGCTKLDSVTVTQNITKPTVTVTQPAVLTCTTTAVNLTATSAGSTITWTGFAANQNPVSVTAPGKYYVTATATNGCTKLDSVTVTQDITKPTVTVTQPAVLTCTITAVNLTATSAGSTITWTGFASGQNQVSVTAPGKYYVTATSANGCTKLDSVTVTQDITEPTVTVTQPAVLTCTLTSVNLTATSAGSTITWTGFASGQNPVSVTTPGKYYVTATATNGCTKLDSVTVTQNITKPTVTVTQPAVLNCTVTAVNLTATSAGSTITWTGFASGQNPVSVTTPGKYYVTATASNGCTKLDSVTVTQDITKPNLSVTQPAVLNCTVTAVNLTATSVGSTITWTGFAANQNPVSVTTPGKYYVTATATNGCTKLDSVTVTQDITKPTVTVTQPAVLNCTVTAVNLTATSVGSTITWTGFAANQNPVSVTTPGKYYVTATATNGCTKLDSVTVTQDITKPTITVTQPAVLTCTITAVNLSATSAGSTITWTGFASGQNPVSVTEPGKYYVTATAANGCTKLDSVTVTQDITKPTVTVTQPAVLTCTLTSVNLTATSAGSTITWTGFAANQNPVSVTTPGKYYVTATATNGCTKLDSLTVIQDITKPNLSVTQPPVLTCTNTAVSLSATSAGSTITWTGFASGQNPVSVTTPGKYYVTATASNGCTKLDSVTVTQDTVKPNLSIIQPPVITCLMTSVSLKAESTTPNTTFAWIGFTAGQNPVTVTAANTYSVTVTNNSNGCITTGSVTTIANKTAPANVRASNDGPITCLKTSVTLKGESETTDATFQWSSQSGFSANTPTAPTSVAETYTLVVINPANGCGAITNTTVIANKTAPADVRASNNGPITCDRTSVTLTGQSATAGATFQWSSPSGFSANTPTAVTVVAETYTLVVTNPNNGCGATTNTTVVKNVALPAAVITPPTTAPDPLTVDLLTAQNVANATYTWTLTSADNSWAIIDGAATSTLIYQAGNAGVQGTFNLLVKDRGNGCTNSAQLVLTPASLALSNASNQSLQSQSLEVKAYPNPFTETAFITFKAPVSGMVTVEIYGSHGNLERVLLNQNVQSGLTYKLTLQAGNLPAGPHYCVIRANGKRYSSKLILVR